MPLVKNTATGINYLEKINTDGDVCSRTAIRSYNKQLGSQGAVGRTRFFLPFNYDPGSHTLWVFVNGLKAVYEVNPLNNMQYNEITNKSVQFGAALNPTDVLEFIVAGSYFGDAGEGGSGGLTWLLTSDNGIQVADGYGYMADTRASSLVFNLPESPVEGDVFAVADAFLTFTTNSVTLNNNGKKVNGQTANYVFGVKGMAVHFAYDGIDNWVVVSPGDILPSQTGHTGKFLQTNGSAVSWQVANHNTLVNYEADRHRKITVSTSNATGGSNGDVWIKIYNVGDGYTPTTCP